MSLAFAVATQSHFTPVAGALLLVAALCYLIASVYYGAGTVRPDASQRSQMLAFGLAAAVLGAIAHTAAIGARCIETHLPPLVNAPDTLSATGWAIALAFLLLQLTAARERTTALGAVSMPLAFLAVFTGSALRLGRASNHTAIQTNAHGLDGNLVNLHVLAIIFAFGLLTLAVGCAALYLVEDSLLKRKSVAQLLFWRLPPLTTIDNLAFTLVSLAFPLLTIGILAGIIRAVAERNAFTAWGFEPHTLASVVTWAIYGGYLWLHTALAWRGPRANSLLIAGIIAALLTYIVPSRLHQFG